MKYITSIAFALAIFTAKSQNIDGMPDSLPANMYPDAIHAPFYHGVGSFDPAADGVIIWTKITPNDVSFPATVHYQVATDSLFASIVTEGDTQTTANSNFTLALDIVGLTANAKYYYRFRDIIGNYSVVGQTHTLPVGHLDNVKIGVASCSSIFSGYFNAYRHIGNNPDILALFHVGDYTYDFVDVDEQVRIPSPYPTEPQNLNEFRNRHAYYLLDPDLRFARQMKPFVAMWDNHDIQNNPLLDTVDQGVQAFEEYCPWRKLVTTNNAIIYRKITFGDLFELSMTDLRLHRYVDTLSGGETNLLGNQQFSWLTNNLRTSETRWQVIGSQKMIGGWYTTGFPDVILQQVPHDGPVFDNGGWDGFQETRNMLFDTIAMNNINNCVFITGDAHISVAMDLNKTPQDTLAYNESTGEGSIGVEFLPTSISRGNFNEQGVTAGELQFLIPLNKNANPQQIYTEVTKHGYGILDIKPDSVVATFMYLSKDSINSDTTDTKSLTVLNGANHWKRNPVSPSGINERSAANWTVFPNPNNTGMVNFLNPQTFKMFDITGKLIISGEKQKSFSVRDLPSGYYTLVNEKGQAKKVMLY